MYSFQRSGDFSDESLCPQGLFPHIFSNWDSGIEPHHPTLHYGRHLHAEGESLRQNCSNFVGFV